VPRQLIWVALPVLAVAVSAVWQARANFRLERQLEQLATRLDHAQEPTPPAQCVASLDPALLRQAVSAALSDLWPSALPRAGSLPPAASSRATASADDSSAANTPKTTEAIEAFDAANRLLDAAIARHTWSSQDAQALRGLGHALYAQERVKSKRVDIKRRVVRAINAQQLPMTGDNHHF
jgi:hypothetical protein